MTTEEDAGGVAHRWGRGQRDATALRRGGTGPLVVPLHGFPESWYAWRHHSALAASGYWVVAPDLRGYNTSDKPPPCPGLSANGPGPERSQPDRRLDAGWASVAGYDWGGAVAWLLAMLPRSGPAPRDDPISAKELISRLAPVRL
jgi:pimeloyl-ACP methyl ester carboxylesterase